MDIKQQLALKGAGNKAVLDFQEKIRAYRQAGAPAADVAQWRKQLYEQGMTAVKGAFSPEWAQRLREEYAPLMEEARSRTGGVINRGPNRFYHAIHPERLSGFVEVITHPAFTGLCESVLGPDYSIVEVSFDVPMPGAKDQPWHRDFPIGSETLIGGWLSSLAFNLTTVDVTEEMGAFEIALGTQFEDGIDFDQGMFPHKDQYERYAKMAKRCYPKAGDMSCRTGLTIHRGTEHNAGIPRPVLIVGVIANLLVATSPHGLTMTRKYFESLPESVRQRLLIKNLTDELTPIEQAHDIEGLRYAAVN